VPLIRLDGGVFDLPTTRGVETKLERPKGRQDAPSVEKFEQRLQLQVRQIQERKKEERILKDAECGHNAQNLRLERGFNLNFVRGSSSGKEKPGIAAKQLPLLAAKIRREFVDGGDGGGAEDADTMPLNKLLDRAMPVAEPAASQVAFELGDEVEVRDKDMAGWRLGVVTETTPLKVTLHEWDQGFQWDSVRRPEAKQTPPKQAKQCLCGNLLLEGANFCSACGKKRTTDLPAAPRKPASKPPRPPEHTSRMPSARGVATRRKSAPPARRSVDRAHGDAATAALAGGVSSARGTGGSDTLKDCRERSFAWRDAVGERTLTPHSSNSKWEQGTVPILGENGDIFPIRAGERNQHCWEEHTVPILGDNGEIFAIRPGAGILQQAEEHDMPILVNSSEATASRPGTGNQAKWEERTVPLLGDNGEVVAIRPSGDRHEMLGWRRPLNSSVASNSVSRHRSFNNVSGDTSTPPWMEEHDMPILGNNSEAMASRPGTSNQAKWEERTVPILGNNGEVVAIRPSGDRYEMPGWRRPLNSSGGKSVASRTGSDANNNRSGNTSTPPWKVDGRNDDDEVCLTSGSDGASFVSLGTSMLPLPSVGTSASGGCANTRNTESLQDSDEKQRWSTLEAKPWQAAEGGQCTPQERGAIEQACFESGSGTASAKSLGTSMLPLPSAGTFGLGDHETTGRSEPWMGPGGGIESSYRGTTSERCQHHTREGDTSGTVTLPSVGTCDPRDQATTLPTEPRMASLGENSSNNHDSLPQSAAESRGRSEVANRLQSASVDSLKSIDEIIRMANLASQDTPEGLTLDFLKEVLITNTPIGSPSHGHRKMLAPLADELATRIAQLPELWRGTICQLLEEAEAVHKAVASLDE